jgi:alkylated DNA repair dioxygenase AlkB
MEGMSWHSDKTKEFGNNTTIATLSLGSERRFDLKHTQTGEKVSIVLQHGSLLIMTGSTQIHWLHQVPKTKKIIEPRISLTFRQLLQMD